MSGTKTLKLAALLLSFSALGACYTHTPAIGNVFEENRFQVAESIERLELYPRRDGIKLNVRDAAAMRAFIRDFRQNGDGELYINLPSSGLSGVGIQQTQAIVQQALLAEGLNTSGVRTGSYNGGNVAAPVVVSYRKLSALIPRCEKFSDLGITGNNQPHKGFGCAHFANQAVMIGDPAQLIGPYDVTPADPIRRSKVYQDYLKGVDASSQAGARQSTDFGG